MRLIVPIEYRAADEYASGPGTIAGRVLTYGERALDRPERFMPGALSWDAAGVMLHRQHNTKLPIMRLIPEVRGREVWIDAKLPDTTIGRDTAIEVRNGTFKGLSVEFGSLRETRQAGVRQIHRAMLTGIGLVGESSYSTTVEVRNRQQWDTLRRSARAWL